MGTAVLALHYQNEVLHPEGRIGVGMARDAADRARVVAAARRLLDGARAAGLPVVSVRIAFRPDHADLPRNAPIFRDVARLGAVREGSWGAAFLDGLGPLEGEAVVTHSRIGAFSGTDLDARLGGLGIGRLIVAGVATTSVVLTTVGQAVDLGYEVTVAGDACSAGRADLHEAALEILGLVAEVATAEEALRRLGPGRA